MSIAGLLIKPIPYLGESADSFLLRAAQLNKHSSVNNLFGRGHLDFLAKHAPNCNLVDLPRFKYVLEILNIDPQYEHLAFERTAPTSRSDRKWNNIEIDYELLKYFAYSYCPTCLSEKPFFRKLWLLKPIYACPTHSIFLLDHCHQCGNSIRLSSGEITTCSSCAASLKDAPTTYCSSISNVKWFVNLINQSSNEIFQQFSSYWQALDQFSKQDKTITIAQHLKITREYLINPEKSVARLSRWVNKQIHLAHPRVQLLPFLKHSDMFYEYTKLIESNCDQYTPNPHSRNINLTPGEARFILDVSPNTFRIWVNKDFLKLGQNTYQYSSYSSNNIEQFLISKKNQNSYVSQPLPKGKQSPFETCIGLKDIAEKLDINYDTARKLVKIKWVDFGKLSIEGTTLKGFSHSKIEEFNRKYIIASALAKRIGVNPTNLVEMLIRIGINPISGPHIDAALLNIFTRSSTERVVKSDLDKIEGYQTRAGRRPKTSEVKELKETAFLSLRDAASKLGISTNKTAVLAQKEILSKDQSNPFSVMIERESLLALMRKLNSKAFVNAKEAALQLNCTMNWLVEYWGKSGFLEIHDLVYWKLIKRSELDQILKIKDEYFTGAEASKYLGMHHSHISNLQKRGIIEPIYHGKGSPIRLFRRSDVSQLKELNKNGLATM